MNTQVFPTTDQLYPALVAASHAHHEYEQNALRGEQDERWAGWYAAYVLGRLGDFVSPSLLRTWLQAVDSGDPWAMAAAAYVHTQMAMLDG